jgi:hypothetical protein
VVIGVAAYRQTLLPGWIANVVCDRGAEILGRDRFALSEQFHECALRFSLTRTTALSLHSKIDSAAYGHGSPEAESQASLQRVGAFAMPTGSQGTYVTATTSACRLLKWLM